MAGSYFDGGSSSKTPSSSSGRYEHSSSSDGAGSSSTPDIIRKQVEYRQFLAKIHQQMEQKLDQNQHNQDVIGRYSTHLDTLHAGACSLLRRAEENVTNRLMRHRRQMTDVQADVERYSTMLRQDDQYTDIALQALSHFTRERSELQQQVDELEGRTETIRDGIQHYESTYDQKRGDVDAIQGRLDEEKDRLQRLSSTLDDLRLKAEEEDEA